nr:MAG TPA: hypothetical protein [Caudoviricetes sp.]
MLLPILLLPKATFVSTFSKNRKCFSKKGVILLKCEEL